jgi:hypothetical protein
MCGECQRGYAANASTGTRDKDDTILSASPGLADSF